MSLGVRRLYTPELGEVVILALVVNGILVILLATKLAGTLKRELARRATDGRRLDPRVSRGFRVAAWVGASILLGLALVALSLVSGWPQWVVTLGLAALYAGLVVLLPLGIWLGWHAADEEIARIEESSQMEAVARRARRSRDEVA